MGAPPVARGPIGPIGTVVATKIDPAVLGPIVVSIVGAEAHLPVESSGRGGVFTDRFDPNLFWWLPDYRLAPTPDAAFSFAASAGGVGSGGLPFFTAQLTFGIVANEPAGLAAARAADPGATFEMIAPTSLDVALTLIGKTDSGADDPHSYDATLEPTSTTGYTATITLTGSAVTIAYAALALDSSATVAMTCSYAVWRSWHPWIVRPIYVPPDVIETHPQSPQTAAGAEDRADTGGDGPGPEPADLPLVGVLTNGPVVRRFPPIDGPIRRIGDGVDLTLTRTTWVTATGQSATAVPIGATYAADAYRPRFTVTTGPPGGTQTRPIVDAGDLTGFAGAHSEFIELTSLGSPTDRYPSIRRLYFGLVSRRVVIVPQAYRIRRGSDGLAAALHAAVDDSPGPHVSGTRFEFTFTLAPDVDPLDFAQLARDLPGVPEAAGRPVSLVFADGLDPRTPSAFTGFSACTSVLVDGDQPAALSLRVTIVDQGQTPALDLVNLFLDQLGSTVTPMTGVVALRLDDVYPTPVDTAMVIELADTVGADELSFTAADATTVDVRNVGPVALHLSAAASIGPDGLQDVALDTVLVPNATTPIPVADSSLPLAVRSELSLGSLDRPVDVLSFLDVEVQTTQMIRHVLSVNAAGALSGSVTQLDIIPTLVQAPTIVISALTLTAAVQIGSVACTLPLQTALTDLTAQLAVTITDGSSTRHLMLTHDFSVEPILIITTDDVQRGT